MTKIQKQALALIGTIASVFAVLVIANKLQIESYWLNPILIFTTLTLRSKQLTQKILGISAFVIFAISLIFHFGYIGYLSAIANIAIISGLIYVYDTVSFTDNRTAIPGRGKAIIAGIAMLILSQIPYIILDVMLNDTFLEWGGKTAIIYGLTLVCEHMAKTHEQQAKQFVEYKKENVKEKTPPTLLIKALSVWLIVFDLSVISYVVTPNETGFGIAFGIAIVTLIMTLFNEAVKKSEDVLTMIYTWLRPFQPIAFLILLIAHEKSLTLDIFYVAALLGVHTLWLTKSINLKTGLLLSSVVIFLPVFGYLSNPYRYITNSRPNVKSVLFERANPDTHLMNLNDFFTLKNTIFNDNIFNNSKAPISSEPSTSELSRDLQNDNKLKRYESTKNERLYQFAEQVNSEEYSTPIKNSSNDEAYLVYQLEIIDESPYKNEQYKLPMLKFNVRVRNRPNMSSSHTLEPRDWLQDKLNSKDDYQSLLQKLTEDNILKKTTLEDGEYYILYTVYDEFGHAYTQKTLKTEITKGHIKVLTLEDYNNTGI